jgi:protocatechuate 3,4-dioxygenase beta subunit
LDPTTLAAPGAELVIALERGCTVRGLVVDDQDRPLAGARVDTFGSDESEEGQLDFESSETAADGRFAFIGLRREMPHALVVRADGCATFAGRLDALPRDVNDFDLGKLVLERGGLIAGRVVDASGQPVSQAKVQLIPADAPDGKDSPSARSAGCDPLGCFALGQLPAGEYLLRGSRSASSETAKTTVSLGPGERRTDVELGFGNHRGVIAGRVIDPEGQPIRDVTLDLSSLRASQPMVRTKSAGDGSFAFGELAPDTYQLKALPRRSRLRDGLAVAELTLTNLRPDLPDLVVALPRALSIEGAARDAHDAPLALAMIVAYDEHGERIAGAVSRDDGSFELFVPEHAVVDLQLIPHQGGGFVQLGGGGARETRFALRGVRPGTQNLVLRP